MATAEHQQNGRRSFNHVAGHPADPRLRDTTVEFNRQTSRLPICRNFVRGTCNQSGRCKYRHEWDLAEIKNQEIIKFCHDFQNHVCCREGCTYLHASKEEEERFWANGQLPRILAERHAGMAAASNMQNGTAMFGFMCEAPPPPPNGYMMGPPPPPPPRLQQAPPPPPVAVVLPPPPPPPPPLPPPAEPPATAATAAPPHQSLPDQASTGASIKKGPLPKFDASRPPPQIVPNLKKTKRPESIEAGPCKVPKLDSPNCASSLCIHCVRRQLRISFYKQKIKQLSTEEEQCILTHKERLEVFEKWKELLKSLTPAFNVILEKHIESAPQVSPVDDFMSSITSQPVANLMSMNILRQLMSLMFAGGRNFMDSSIMADEDDLLQSLSAVQRRNATSISNTTNNNTRALDLLHNLLQSVQNNSHGGGAESQPRSEVTPAVAAYHPARPPPSLFYGSQPPKTATAWPSGSAPPPITAASWLLKTAAVPPTVTTCAWPPSTAAAPPVNTTCWPTTTTATTNSLPPPPPPPANRKYPPFTQ